MCLTRYRMIDSPIGLLTLAGQGDVLTNLVIEGAAHPPSGRDRWVEDAAAFPDVVDQLAAYFAAKRTGFDVALCPAGTSFQRRVWDALSDIPYGETRSYGEIARRIGQPAAARAVGLANGRNPIPVIIPCHRVIGAKGTLTGYAGGLQAKQALLDLEQACRAGRHRDGQPGGRSGSEPTVDQARRCAEGVEAATLASAASVIVAGARPSMRAISTAARGWRALPSLELRAAHAGLLCALGQPFVGVVTLGHPAMATSTPTFS